MRFIALSLLALSASAPAFAQTTDERARVFALIAEWYERISHFEARALGAYGPRRRRRRTGLCRGPLYSPVAAQRRRLFRAAHQHRVGLAGDEARLRHRRLILNADLAKVDVWERGYFFAAAAQKTYERGVDVVFVLQKMDTGQWNILAHKATLEGIPPNKITNRMPDPRDEY